MKKKPKIKLTGQLVSSRLNDLLLRIGYEHPKVWLRGADGEEVRFWRLVTDDPQDLVHFLADVKEFNGFVSFDGFIED